MCSTRKHTRYPSSRPLAGGRVMRLPRLLIYPDLLDYIILYIIPTDFETMFLSCSTVLAHSRKCAPQGAQWCTKTDTPIVSRYHEVNGMHDSLEVSRAGTVSWGRWALARLTVLSTANLTSLSFACGPRMASKLWESIQSKQALDSLEGVGRWSSHSRVLLFKGTELEFVCLA